MELLLVEDDPQDRRDMELAIADYVDDFYLIDTTDSAQEAVKLIVEKKPDAVLLDLELTLGSGSGLDVLLQIKQRQLSRPPYILVVTNNISPLTHKIAREFGADYIMTKTQKDYTPKTPLNFLQSLKKFICERKAVDGSAIPQYTPEQRTKMLQRKIQNKLNRIGINPKAVGYQYLTDAIELLVCGDVKRSIPLTIAQKYRKSEPSVERAMQNAINRTWETQDTDILYKYYTAKINSATGNPTLTEFIYYYASQLKNEY